MSAIREEIRFAFRALARSPAFTLIAVLTLALGVGANVAILAVVRNVLLRPLPYAQPERLVRLWANNIERGLPQFSVSPDEYVAWRTGNRTLESMSAFERQRDGVLTGLGDAREITLARIAPDLIPFLGVSPALGRGFTERDASGDARVVMISDGFWKAELGGDTRVLERTLVLDGVPHAVIGVMPPGFQVPFNPAVAWTPMQMRLGQPGRYLRVLGRLRAGVTPEQAAADIRAIADVLSREFPATNTGWSVTLMTVQEAVVGESFRSALMVLLGVVGIVLLVACANVSNLLLSRVLARRQEVAVRSALGASRMRLIRQWLTEGALLGALAALPGLLLGLWAVMLLRTMNPEAVPRVAEIRVDVPVAFFTIGVSIFAGALLGALPGLLAARSSGHGLTEDARGVSGGVRVGRLRSLVLVGELAFSVVLLIGTMLLLRSFQRVQAIDPGFEANGVTVAAVALPTVQYDPQARVRFFDDLLQRVRALPGVESAAAVTSAPFAGPNSGDVFLPEHLAGSVRDQPPDADMRTVTPGYFQTLRLPLVSGRTFQPRDTRDSVAIISRALARRYWPAMDPIGARVRIGDLQNGPVVRVIGVVEDARYQSLENTLVRPMMYLAHTTTAPAATMQLVVRTRGAGDDLLPGIRRELAALDPALAIGTAAPLADLVESAFAERRFHVMLFALFAGTALLLALVGLYGVMAYMVVQRTREMGVRLALGAGSGDLIRLVLGRAVRVTLAGLTLGIIAALGLTNLLQKLLFDTQPNEPAAYIGVAALVLFVSACACYLPARRAAKLDPATALRT
jgi:putative ABC transport system permease protein